MQLAEQFSAVIILKIQDYWCFLNFCQTFSGIDFDGFKINAAYRYFHTPFKIKFRFKFKNEKIEMDF